MIAFFEVEVDEFNPGNFCAVIDYFGKINFWSGGAHLLSQKGGIGYFKKKGITGLFVVLQLYVGIVTVQVTDDDIR